MHVILDANFQIIKTSISAKFRFEHGPKSYLLIWMVSFVLSFFVRHQSMFSFWIWQDTHRTFPNELKNIFHEISKLKPPTIKCSIIKSWRPSRVVEGTSLRIEANASHRLAQKTTALTIASSIAQRIFGAGM